MEYVFPACSGKKNSVKQGEIITVVDIEGGQVGEHDLLHPCCRPEMYDFFYKTDYHGLNETDRL